MLGDKSGRASAPHVSPLGLRVGSWFAGELGGELHLALRKACRTIARMPTHRQGPILQATHTTWQAWVS
jgi:hypothetical protein